MKYVIQLFGLLMFVCGLGWYIDYLAHDELVTAARWLIAVMAISGGAAVLTTTVVLALILVERFRMTRARRKEAEKNAAVMVITAGHNEQVYIRDNDGGATWRQAHLDARVMANGKLTPPTETEYRAWGAFHTPRIEATAGPALMPGVIQVDLMAALDSVQRCLIVGASDSGKTTLLQWLVSRRLNTSQVIVIDPHSYPDKYPAGCDVIGLGRNYPEIERALAALVKLMTKRYDEIGRGVVAEMHHSRVTILIDEWRAITGNLGKPASDAIKALLTESRKAAFSVFVASHSDRARPLGLEGEYDLKDGFAIVKLSNINGNRQATIDTGNGEMAAVLPGAFNSPAPQVIEHGPLLSYSEPDDTESDDDFTGRVIEMYQAGETITGITRRLFGYKNQTKVQQIKQILVNNGLVG